MTRLRAFALTAYAVSLLSGAAFPAELMQGQCRMDHCTWFSVESRDLVGSNAKGALFKAELKGWTSHHPNGSYGRRSPKTGGNSSASYFLCSKTKPSAIWQDDNGHWMVAGLNLGSPAGAEENAVIEYFAICHGIQSGSDRSSSFEELTQRFGYGPLTYSDLREIARPEDILKD
jgi:hypothetical protein